MTLHASWLKTSLICPETTLEAVSDLLGVLSGSAVEQTPVQDGLSTISAFFQLGSEEDKEKIICRVEPELAELFAAYGLPAPQLACSTLADEDWAVSWQQFFTPFAIVPGLIIKPSWENYAAQSGEQVIEMDPGMAFGTGQHASTKLALRLMQTACRENPPRRVLDIGTGTGILAMAAALFGAQEVIATDNDPEAVQAAAENIVRNSLADKIAVSADDLATLSGGFDLICANILHDVLAEMAPAIARLLAADGQLVLSGILKGAQEDSLVRLYSRQGLILRQAAHEEEWAALLLDNKEKCQ
jgi:ribosomal protein L11 methyltransferase